MGEFLGIDVAKDSLVVWTNGRAQVLKNKRVEIRRFVRDLPKDARVGIEATSTYHLLFCDEAHAAGVVVYALNPVDCARYRQALAARGKTDLIDAQAIARFVQKEHDSMRPYQPLPESVAKLRSLIRRRDKALKARTMLELSLSGDKELLALARPALKKLGELVAKIEARMEALAKQMEGAEELSSIAAVGTVNLSCFLATLSVGGFKSADAYVAYVGLDCRPKESGTVVGTRFVSCRGDRHCRKNLYMAAMSGCTMKAWKPYYDRQLAKGLSRTQALVALARKMARTAWSVYTHRKKFDPARISLQNT
jgi:transposase